MEIREKFKNTAVFNGKCFQHFGIRPITASLYGDKISDIINVEIEVAEDQTRPNFDNSDLTPDYWCWRDKEGKFSMIYAKYFLLNMCFPSGIEASENAGQGKAYRVLVTKLEN